MEYPFSCFNTFDQYNSIERWLVFNGMWSSCGRKESKSGKSTIEKEKNHSSIRMKRLRTAAVASEATEL